MSMDTSSLILVAHGSRDPRAGWSTRALARAVQDGMAGPGGEQRRPAGRVPASAPFAGRVSAAFLDFGPPRLADVLAAQAARGARNAVVVPLLLTAAYHGRVDVPAEVDRARASGLPIAIGLAEVLGPVGDLDGDALDLMVAALVRRLDETGALGGGDAIVLAAAGSRDEGALRTVDRVAAALGEALGRPCRAGYASGTGPAVARMVAALRAGGARRIAVGSYFLAPGLLHDRAVEQARQAGAFVAAAPLGDAPEVARLVLHRATAVPLIDSLAA